MSISTRGPSQEGNYNKLLIPKMMVLTFSALISKMMASFGPSPKPVTLKGLPYSTIKTTTTEKKNIRQYRKFEHGAIKSLSDKQSAR